jgi:hypothetical protein
MKIQLRQSGGIADIDHQVDFDRSEVRVSRAGTELHARKLEVPEAAKVRSAAKRLLSKSPPAQTENASLASDSMLTEISISDARRQMSYRVRSGEDAPAELWDLVDALSDAAVPR